MVAVGVRGDVVATGARVLRHLAEYPGVGRRGTADHHGVATSHLYDTLGIFGRIHVAVADYWNADGLLDRRNQGPIGAAAVALGSGAGMDRDAFDSRIFGHSCNVDGHYGILVPASAQF